MAPNHILIHHMLLDCLRPVVNRLLGSQVQVLVEQVIVLHLQFRVLLLRRLILIAFEHFVLNVMELTLTCHSLVVLVLISH